MSRFAPVQILVVFLLAGCAVPASMHVRLGGEPHHQDDDVLFRTTYYFRVFDFCEDQGTGNQGTGRQIKSDSLYRFKMTGKSDARINKVRFESGTLYAWQIDPFGSAIEFDKDTGKPYYVSQQKRDERLQQDKLYADFDRLRALWVRLGCQDTDKQPAKEQCDILNNKMKDTLNMISPVGVTKAPNPEAPNPANASTPVSGSSSSASTDHKTGVRPLLCGDGLPARRGFQILGPEGWRTFDQDERLVLAMSSSARPLLDSLRELAQRALAERAAGVSQERLLQASLVSARTRVAVNEVERATDESFNQKLDAVMAAFGTGGGK